MSTINTVDAVNDCAYVLNFLSEAFIIDPGCTKTLSYGAATGLSLLLSVASDRLFYATEECRCCRQTEVQP